MYASEDLAPTWQESIAHLAGFLTALEATAGETRLACDVAFAKWRQAAGILRARGDINFHVSATSYGMVETCHAALLHFWLDGMAQEAARVR